jgi:hypothetical protein
VWGASAGPDIRTVHPVDRDLARMIGGTSKGAHDDEDATHPLTPADFAKHDTRGVTSPTTC